MVGFLEVGQTVNAARYIQTLSKFRRALREKRPGKIILQHYNARSHIAHVTVTGNSLYNPDLASSATTIFRFC